jgi:hypothetical protein
MQQQEAAAGAAVAAVATVCQGSALSSAPLEMYRNDTTLTIPCPPGLPCLVCVAMYGAEKRGAEPGVIERAGAAARDQRERAEEGGAVVGQGHDSDPALDRELFHHHAGRRRRRRCCFRSAATVSAIYACDCSSCWCCCGRWPAVAGRGGAWGVGVSSHIMHMAMRAWADRPTIRKIFSSYSCFLPD